MESKIDIFMGDYTNHVFYLLYAISPMHCRIEQIQRKDGELPGDFDNEIHKWALEC